MSIKESFKTRTALAATKVCCIKGHAQIITGYRISTIMRSIKPHVIKCDHEYDDMIGCDRQNQNHLITLL